jgi:hypothetical protein
MAGSRSMAQRSMRPPATRGSPCAPAQVVRSLIQAELAQDFFLFHGGVGQGDGIEHGFEQADDGGELRRRKPVD